MHATAEQHSFAGELAAVPGLELARDVSLAPRTSFGIGGPAELLVTASSIEAVAATTTLAKAAGVPLVVLGGGTNLLISDRGVAGIVLELGGLFDYVRDLPSPDGCVRWEVGAACGAAKLVRRAARRGLMGLEMLCGVPGTLGGALVMNAGGREAGIGQSVERVRLVSRGEPLWLDGSAAGFAYRQSRFPPESVLLAAELHLTPGDVSALQATMRDAQAQRRATQPLGLPSAGSVFKNPPGDFAGRLVEQAGCKGWREGEAEVSRRHANFIVNRGGASAADVWRLIERVRARVREHAGVELTLELRLVGDLGGEEA